MLIIGITGTLGAGKGTIVEYLIRRRGFLHYSVRGYLTEEIRRRGLPVDRPSMVLVANDLRASHSPSFLVEELYRLAEAAATDCVIESIRTPGEVEALRRHAGFRLLAVDAPRRLRYERVLGRASNTDRVSFEQFTADEELEMRSEDPNRQNLSRCIALADYSIDNAGTVEELDAKVERILGQIGGGHGNAAAG